MLQGYVVTLLDSGSNDKSKSRKNIGPKPIGVRCFKWSHFFGFCATKKIRDVVLTPEKSQKPPSPFGEIFRGGAGGVETKQNMLWK